MFRWRLNPLILIVCFMSTIAGAALILGRFSRSNHSQTPAPEAGQIVSVTQSSPKMREIAPEIVWNDKQGKSHRLSEYRGKPVLLCIGSGTCGPFRSSMNMLKSTVSRFGGRVASFLIYTKEAHPDLSDRPYTHSEKSLADRQHSACDMSTENNLNIPVLVDNATNQAASTYKASPSRIYVLDGSGRIVYASMEYPSSNMAMGAAQTINSMMAQQTESVIEMFFRGRWC